MSTQRFDVVITAIRIAKLKQKPTRCTISNEQMLFKFTLASSNQSRAREQFTHGAAIDSLQCSIHCASSRVARGAIKRRCTPQNTRDTPKGVQN